MAIIGKRQMDGRQEGEWFRSRNTARCTGPRCNGHGNFTTWRKVVAKPRAKGLKAIAICVDCRSVLYREARS